MERYGHDFDRDRWGGMGSEMGWGGRGRARPGGRDDFRGQAGRGRMGGYGAEYEDWGGGMGGRQGGYGGMGGRGFAQRDRGGRYMGGGFGGGYQTGYQEDYSGYGQPGGYGGGTGIGGGRWGRGDQSSRVRASEIMTENPEVVTPDTTLTDAARKMRELNVGIVPVVESEENRRLRGVITDRDIAIRAVAEGKDASSTKVSDIMTTDLEVCNKNDSVRDVLDVMQREQVRRVPITDREGRLVGIIAQADVAVDFLEEQPRAKRDVARTLRRVSEPAEPEGVAASGSRSRGRSGRGGGGARGSQQRGEEE